MLFRSRHRRSPTVSSAAKYPGLSTFLGSGVDSHRDQDVRRALIPLVKTATESGTAVLAVRHLKKGQQSSAMHRGMGSIAFTGLARTDADAQGPASICGMVEMNGSAIPYWDDPHE